MQQNELEVGEIYICTLLGIKGDLFCRVLEKGVYMGRSYSGVRVKLPSGREEVIPARDIRPYKPSDYPL